MTSLKEKIEIVRDHAAKQTDILLCARILSVCDAARRMDEAVNGTQQTAKKPLPPEVAADFQGRFTDPANH